MNITTLLPFILVGTLLFLVWHFMDKDRSALERQRRERALLDSLPPRSTLAEQTPNTTNVNSPGARTNVHHHQSQQITFSYGELSRLLREEATRVPQDVADAALSHADALDAAVANDAEESRDQAVGRIQRFLLTAGDGFQATQHLLSLLGN
ncbi:hypothetical protein [Streptomyces qinzhouensis]|uniref:Uncharacterized protein n=1 Tax=Streptomyces qinzhouensis TaxID=2599401 RepID=A0A5B8JE83_9ACTN|nr:hypothetical protein [Streptomyces qinzhouensis]QDY78251.1 hypothetical protein FQU76_19095 [Streptomyces qinzhouensis]